MKRRRIRFSAWLALFVVAFAQMATAAYACPLIRAAFDESPPMVAMEAPCAEMAMDSDVDVANLCVEHCKVGQQLVDSPQPLEAMQPALVFLHLTSSSAETLAIARPAVRSPIPRATAPPVYASSARLRI